MTETIEIPLTNNQAEALRSDIADINNLAQAHQIRVSMHARHRDTIVKDSGAEPASVESFEVVEINKNFYLRLTPKEIRKEI